MSDFSSPNTTTLINNASIGAVAMQPGATAISVVQQSFTGFAPAMLHGPIKIILDEFRAGNKEAAKAQLKVVRTMGGQDPGILPALEVVSIYLNLLDAGESEQARGHLTSYLSQHAASSALLSDLCYAALLRLEIGSKRVEAAWKVWKQIDSPGCYAKKTFLTFMAEADELAKEFERGPLLTSEELLGIGEGAIRLCDYQMAQVVSKQLELRELGPAGHFFQLLARIVVLQQATNNQHFWTLEASTYEQLMQIAEATAEMLSAEPVVDSRLPSFAARLLHYIHFESENLTKACWSRIALIESTHKDCAVILRFHFEKDVSELSDLSQKLHKAEKDGAFRKSYIETLLFTSVVTDDECAFLARYASPASLASWLDNGGSVSGNSEFGKELLAIYLRSCSVESKRHDSRNLREACQSFLDRFKDELSTLNPEFAVDLAGKLISAGLPHEAYCFIINLLPAGEIWLSPLSKCYLDALITSEKYELLAKTLDLMPERFWTRGVWQTRARLECLTGKFDEAKVSLEKGMSFGVTPQLVLELIAVLRSTGNENEIPELLAKVPESSLTVSDENSRRVIQIMLENGLENVAECILLDWFINDPQASAVPITEVFSGIIARPKPVTLRNLSENNALIGIKYSDGKSTLTKVIVPPDTAHNQYFISSESPLGKRLLEALPQEPFKEGVITYTVEERLPALIAAYHISLHIRDNANQGDDPFHMFNVSDDINDFVVQMHEMMSTNNQQQRSVLEQDNLPIMFKGHYVRGYDPFGAAIGLLSDASVPKSPLPDFASDVLPDSIVLDVYALAYLTITGLSTGLISLKIRLCITAETESCVRQWLSERERESGGTLSPLPDGKLLLFTTEENRHRTEHIAQQLQVLLGNAEVIRPSLTDINPELIEFREYFDFSVYSVLHLSLSMNIPWLCIDLTMAQVVDSIGCPVVKNSRFLFTEASRLSTFKDRKYGLFRHSLEKLPFPVMLRDLFELSRDDDTHSIEVLAKLIRQYPNAFQNAEHAAHGLELLLGNALFKEWCEGIISGLSTADDFRFPRHVKMLAYSCLYVISQNYKENPAEYNVAYFVHTMAKYLANAVIVPIWVNQLVGFICQLATGFLQGHFMNTGQIGAHLKSIQKLSTQPTLDRDSK